MSSTSPLIDSGDPSTQLALSLAYDVLGYGHPRLLVGNLDGVARIDIGAAEFGGLIGPQVAQSGTTLTITRSGFASGSFALLVPIEGVAIPVGGAGTFFLDPSSLVLLNSRALPTSGTIAAVTATISASIIGLRIGFQGDSFDPANGAPRLTNLVSVLMTV